MLPIKNCIFDLYGTLVDIHTDEGAPALWREMAAEYRRYGTRLSPKQLRKNYLQLVQLAETQAAELHVGPNAHPEIQLEQIFWQLFEGESPLPEEAAVEQLWKRFRSCSTKYLRLYPGASELLQALREAGVGVWLLSNAQRIFTVPELDALGLTDAFDGIYLSSDYGCKKPDPTFFRCLLEEQNIPPESAIMIGNDGTCDIAGAKAVGLRTLYIRSNLSPEEPLPQADHVLEEMDLSQVQSLLLKLIRKST